MNNKISVIIPIYNSEKYLQGCLDSVLSQSYAEWECILIDDGSRDLSGSICDEYSKRDNRFKVIHKLNEGVSCARNTGIEIAEGKWIVFIDSDDYIMNCYLEELMRCVDKDVDFVFSGYTKFQNDKILDVVSFPSGRYSDCMKSKIIHTLSCIGTPWAKLYKREIIISNNIRFEKNLSISEDRLFMYSYLVYANSVFVSDRSDYYYRANEKSISFTVRKPEEYIYRFDALGEKISMIISKWNFKLHIMYPLIDIHLRMEEDIVNRLGLSYLLNNSSVAVIKDYYRINNTSFGERVRIYYNMGFHKMLIYYGKWGLYMKLHKLTNTNHKDVGV